MTDEPALSIRAERAGDLPGILAIHRAAFDSPAEAELVHALRAAEPRVSLVGERAGRLAGHVLFTRVTVGPAGTPALGLAPLAVAPGMQRAGVGAALVRAGLTACRGLGEHAVFVLGHPTYYPRFGFLSAQEHGLFFRDESFAQAFFVVALEPGALAGLRGEVRYRPEFDRF